MRKRGKKGKKKGKRRGRSRGRKNQDSTQKGGDSFVVRPLEDFLEGECVPGIENKMLEEIFALFVEDKDGKSGDVKSRKITPADLFLFFRKFSHGRERPDNYDCKMIIKQIDRSQLDRIAFHDFRRFLKKRIDRGGILEDLGLVFDIFDRDFNGQITPEEVFLTLKDLGEQVDDIEHVRKWLSQYDIDGDEMLDRSEFETILFNGLSLQDKKD